MSFLTNASALSAPANGFEPADAETAVEKPRIVIATVDPVICNELIGTLAGFSVNTVWARSVDYVKALLRKERLAACLCGPWLQDGTFRDLIRHIRRVRIEIPVILASAPAWSTEYGNLLDVVNIGTLGFLPHPYLKADLERLLNLALPNLPASSRRS